MSGTWNGSVKLRASRKVTHAYHKLSGYLETTRFAFVLQFNPYHPSNKLVYQQTCAQLLTDLNSTLAQQWNGAPNVAPSIGYICATPDAYENGLLILPVAPMADGLMLQRLERF